MDTLPDNILAKIFTYLSIEDLIKVQFVSQKWLEIYHRPEIWANTTLKLNENTSPETVENITNLGHMLENIISEPQCFININILEIILKNVHNLKKLNCAFSPPLGFKEVQIIVGRFGDLESITVDTSGTEFLLSLQYLNRLKLREIIFTGPSPSIYVKAQVCKVLGDDFSMLEKVDFISFYSEDEVVEAIYMYFLRKKKDQLLSLKLDINENSFVLSDILKCSSLQKYYIVIRLRETQSIDVLETLIEKFKNCNENFLCPTFLHLSVMDDEVGSKIQELRFHNCGLGKETEKTREIRILWTMTNNQVPEKEILSRICAQFGNLSSLAIWWEDVPDSIQDLSAIINLKNLKDMRIAGLRSPLPDAAFKNISSCVSLEFLLLRNCIKFTTGSLNEQQKRIDSLASMISGLKKLKYLSILMCSFDNLEDYLKTKIVNVCKKQNIVFTYSET